VLTLLEARAAGTGCTFTGGSFRRGTWNKIFRRVAGDVTVTEEDVPCITTAGDGFSLTHEDIMSLLDDMNTIVRAHGAPRAVLGALPDGSIDDPALLRAVHCPSKTGVGKNPPSYYGGVEVNALVWGVKGIWGRMAVVARTEANDGKSDKLTRASVIKKHGVKPALFDTALGHESVSALISEGVKWCDAPNDKAAILRAVDEVLGDYTPEELEETPTTGGTILPMKEKEVAPTTLTPVAEKPAIGGLAERVKALMAAHNLSMEDALSLAQLEV
jgi:hypothetical protein